MTGVGILILPLYITYMGAEAFGLIGFFTMLQAWFGMLDLGLTPTIGRETARYHGGSMSALAYRRLFRALSLIFGCIAVVGGICLWASSERIAVSWLQVSEISKSEVVLSVQIMAISVALRWMGGLYRGVITGSERLVWLSVFNILMGTLRFIAVFFSMWLFGFTPSVFFLHQLIIAILEVFALFLMSRTLLPMRQDMDQPIGWSISPVRPFLKFSLSIALTSSIWILITQTDKLVLSAILPLAEYGYFALAVLVASGIMVISGPISNAVMPRMARLNAEGNQTEMVKVYRSATQLVSVIAGSASLVIAFHSYQLLILWTGDSNLAAHAAPILTLYSLGNALLAIGAFPYYLQYAIGSLRYHLIGNMFMVVMLIPAMVWAATHFGGIGAGYAWLGMNLIYFIFWVGYVHHMLQPGLHLHWLTKDGLIIYLPVFFLLLLFSRWPIESESRWLIFLYLTGVSSVSILVAALASGYIRAKLVGKLRNA